MLLIFLIILFPIALGSPGREVKDIDFPDVPPLVVGAGVPGTAARTTVLLEADVTAQD